MIEPNVETIIFKGEWAIITNKYGKMITYNVPQYNKAYANLGYQKYITRMLETKKYDIFLDVGAYIGLFSQVAAHNCSQVYAFEAHPIYFGLLLNNMKKYNNVKCIYKHVSKEGITPMIETKDQMCFVVLNAKNVPKNMTVSSLEPYNIETTSLDKELCPCPTQQTLIKLDVEGHELNVLDGSKELLKCKNIHWIIDVHLQQGISLEDVKKYFKNKKIELIGFKVLKIT